MYNNSYEEYIRSVLGYPHNANNDITQDFNNDNYYTQNNYDEKRSSELEECYPEIYKIVYPMVQKACQNTDGQISKEKVDEMVDEIYSNIEGNDQININVVNTVNVENRSSNKAETRYFNGKKVIEEPKRQIENHNKVGEKQENRETRQFNRGLSDIIRILLLRELLGRPGCFGGQCRPGPGPRPPRPPFPPPGRPPYFRDLNNDLYEY